MSIEHIHTWIPGTSQRTFLLFHGTGGSERDLIPLASAIDPTANVLGVRGRSLDEGLPRFFRRMSEGIFDEADLCEKTHELADFLVDMSAKYGFDLRESVSLGYSNGANITAAGLLLRPDAFQHAILLRAMVPLSPIETPDLNGHRVLISSGEADSMVPIANVKQLVEMLRAAGAEVEHALYPIGHNLSRADIDAATMWITTLA